MTVGIILICGAVIFATRLLPFIAFRKKNPPIIIRFIQKYISSLIMAVLVIYCFKDVHFLEFPFGLPYIIAAALTVILHLLLKNSLISIFGSTIAFIILLRIM